MIQTNISQPYLILKNNYEDLRKDFELVNQKNKDLQSRVVSLQQILEIQSKINSETNPNSYGIVKTTVIQTRSPGPKKEKIAPQSKGKTYTKVTVGKERLIGEKRYTIRPDGTKEILQENYDYPDPVRQITRFESTGEIIVEDGQHYGASSVESTAKKFQRLFPDDARDRVAGDDTLLLDDPANKFETAYPKYNFVADTSIDGFASKVSKADELYRDSGLLSNPNRDN